MVKLISLDELSGFLGQTVQVNVHLHSHLGNYRNMVYVGDFRFADSCEELMDGKRVLRGLMGFSEHVGEEDRRFTIYLTNAPSDISQILQFGDEKYEQALRLWDSRSKLSK